MADITLKPCPFCGGKAKLSSRQVRFFGRNYLNPAQAKITFGQQVICNKCHARGPYFTKCLITNSPEGKAGFRWLEKSAADAWNKRKEEGQ